MIAFKQNADGSAGLQGSDLDDGGFITVMLPWSAVQNVAGILTVSGPILNRRMVVKAISGVNDVVAANAATATIYRAPSATALGSGTALHTGTFNLQGAAATNQALTLATNSATLDVAAGSRIGMVISTAPGATGCGCITVTLAPA